MQKKPRRTTKINKPDSNKDPYAPQAPDITKPNLGRPLPKITKSTKKKPKTKT